MLDLQQDRIVDSTYKEENIDEKIIENDMEIGGDIVIVDGYKFLIKCIYLFANRLYC